MGRHCRIVIVPLLALDPIHLALTEARSCESSVLSPRLVAQHLGAGLSCARSAGTEIAAAISIAHRDPPDWAAT